ncbi:MAG TPA: HDOD domain-containing protein [Bryobacteraceae bacterium]|jgi:EAL and modified HD-GYP domain-containing signal transduction protein
MEVFVARQAIFDRKRQLYAYELLFRSDASHNQFDGTDAAAATRQVISTTLLSIGLENILCGKKAFLNFDHRLLRDGMHLSLPRQAIVIEILETVQPTADLIALCQTIHKQGYSIALDDFVARPEFEPLTHIAKLIKVDLQATVREEQQRLLRTYQPRGIMMLAEKVETYDEFEWARDAGYDFFQGYFFARPVIVRGRQIPAVQANCLRLLRETLQKDLNFTRLETLIRGDVSLTFKLLRYANSALFGRREKTSSIGRALLVLGEDGIRRWAALATLPMLATNKPGELVTLSIVRARFCERLAQLGGIAAHGDAFMMGMFSLLDALIDCPLDEALREVDLGPGITQALLGTAPEQDALTKLYRLTRRYEIGDWDEIEKLAHDCGVPAATVGAAYMESTVWAERLLGRNDD